MTLHALRVPQTFKTWLVTALVAGGILVASAAALAANPLWDLTGTWALDLTLASDGSHRYHTMNVTAFDLMTGNFSGNGDTTGTVMPPAPILYTWIMTGTESGNAISFVISYNEIPGYEVNLTGIVDSSTMMSGTWADNAGNSGTWTGTGQATPIVYLKGIKFEDEDANGVMDQGELGLPNWEIGLHRVHEPQPEGEPIQTELVALQLTGGDGSFSFPVSTPSRYRLTETAQQGWTQTAPIDSFFDVFVDLSTNPITTDDQGRPLHFGNFKLGEVHGMKFEDKNGNGVLDQGEPGLEGWTIVLTGENHPPHRAITGPDGAYSFFDVFFDVYTLTEESQEGWTQRTSNPFPFTVQSSEVVTGQDFGNFKNVEIIAYKYEDVNADGVNGPEDPPVPGWAITLNGTDTRFTDDNGMVSWIVTTGGDYHIEEEVRPDWIPTAPTFFDVFVTSGDAPYIGEFLNYHYGIISGYKYEDMNNNGVRDADEPGLPGWTITLNPGNQLAFTDQDGYYSFGGLLPGLYTLSEVPQVGWYQSEPDHNIHAVNVTSGTNAERDFGNFRLGSIAGMKFEDVNGNGTHDPEEPGLPNWTIKVYQSTLEVASTVTDADGRYSFIDLIPGPYEVAEVMKPHWGQTLPGGDGILDIFVHSGEGVTDAYFGNFKLGIIEGVKYHDRNGNRAKDPGEPGLPGWRIVLHNLTTGAQAAMLTGPGGMYQFVDLMPGRYLVREQLKSRWIPSSPRNGLYNPVIVDTSGQVLTRDFGNRQVPRAR